MTKPTVTKPAKWKVELVNEVSREIDSNSLSAIVSIAGIRNNQLQSIRSSLKGKMKLQVVRGTLLEKSVERSKKENISRILEVMKGQIALVTGNQEPVELYELLESTRTTAAPRGGEVAENDIVIEPMDTGFPPGPMISEFQKVGLQTAIEKGAIVIKKETVFVKKGEVISKEKAGILGKLNIKPIKVGLNVLGAVKDGIFYSKDVMSISTARITLNMTVAFSQAKQIALNTFFITPEILPEILFRARLSAEMLAVSAGVVDEKNIELFIMKAIRDASAVSSAISGDHREEAASKEEKKPDERDAKKEEEDVSSGLDALFG